MSPFLLDLFPELFDRIEIGGVRRKIEYGQTVLVLRKKFLHGLARVITRAVLNQDDRLAGFGHHLTQISGVGRGGQTLFLALGEESPAKVIN